VHDRFPRHGWGGPATCCTLGDRFARERPPPARLVVQAARAGLWHLPQPGQPDLSSIERRRSGKRKYSPPAWVVPPTTRPGSLFRKPI